MSRKAVLRLRRLRVLCCVRLARGRSKPVHASACKMSPLEYVSHQRQRDGMPTRSTREAVHNFEWSGLRPRLHGADVRERC
jgi:hypothetical protein